MALQRFEGMQFGLQRDVHGGGIGFTRAIGGEIEMMAADNLCRVPAEDRGPCLVCRHDHPIDAHDGLKVLRIFPGAVAFARARFDTGFERGINGLEFDRRLLGDSDIVGDADETDMLAVRIPARLAFGAQPAPVAPLAAVARLQREWLERGFLFDLFDVDPLYIIRMDNMAPVESTASS